MNESVDKDRNKYWDLIKECKLLYRQAKLPMSQTCMCWGIECGPGWFDPIRDMSYRLECINYAIRSKWGFTVEMDQVKSKFGTFRGYFSVRYRAPFLRRILSAPFLWLGLVDPTATGFEKKFGDKIGHFFYSIGYRIRYGSTRTQQKRHVIAQAIDKYVEKIVHGCDNECFGRCEECGSSFSWTPRCETVGWISYVCPKCAKESHSSYRYVFTDEERKFYSKTENGRKILELEEKLLDEDGKPIEEKKPKKPTKRKASSAKKSKSKEKSE